MLFSFRSFAARSVVALLGYGLLQGALPITQAGAGVMTDVTAYWTFNETGGLTAANSGSAGSTLNGTLLEEATFAPGLFGNAVSLPGKPVDFEQGDPTSYVNVGNQVIADGQAEYSISLWFNTAEGSGRRQVFFESGGNYALSGGLASNGRVEHYVQASTTETSVTSFTPAQNQWHHVAITYNHDGSSPGTGTSKIYINGFEFTDAELTSDGVLGSTTYFRIGQHRYPYGEHQSFNGLLDDMAIWDRTLTGHEANAIYRMGQAGLPLSSDRTVHVKANNADNLNTAASWESGVAPGTSSYLVFDNTYTLTSTLDTGSALAVAGLRVTDGTNPIHVANTSTNHLQVGALGVDMTTAQRNLTVANLRLGANQSWDIGTGRTLTVDSLSGDFAVTKNGAGTVLLSGAGSRSGGTTLAEGTLRVGNDSAFGTGTLTLGGGTLSSDGWSGRTLANNVVVNGNVALGHSANRGYLTFTGAVDLGGATRQITTNANVTLSGTVSNGGLIKAGGGTYGTLTLTGANTYAGGTTLVAGTLRVGNDSALGTGSVALNSGTLSSVGATGSTLTNNVTIGGNVIFGSASDSGTLVLSGAVDLGGATRQVTTVADVTLSGIVSNGGLTKSGAGTLSLSGANTYAGGTTVTGGTVAALSSSALGTGAVTLAGGALHVESSIPLSNDIVLDAIAGRNFIRGTVAVDYLVVGGGGGGAGRDSSGGGGAGGVLSNLVTPGMDAIQVVGSGELAVIVGDGGVGGVNIIRGDNGQPSTLGSIVAVGGGAGGPYHLPAADGASGGGSGRESKDVAGTPGQGFGAGTPGQGFAGGKGSGGSSHLVDAGGGGGGAGGLGGDGVASSKGGDGGLGLGVDITGSEVYYGGGGGGTPHRSAPAALASGAGGLGGGGAGATPHTTANPGGANTGGGGGASRSDQGSYYTGGKGGSGVVIARYLGDPAATGGTISAGTGSAAGYTIHAFTDVGTSTLTFDPINATISGAISGSGGFTWDTPGTLTLANANTHAGDTRVTAGTVALGNALAVQNSTLTVAGGTAAFTASGTSSYTLGGLAGTSALDAGSNTLVVGGNNQSTAYGGNLTAAQLTKAGSGTLTLSGSSTLGGTTVSGGALVAASNGALGAGAVTLDGGSLAVERNVTLANQIVLNATAEENVIRGAVAVDYLVVGGGGGGGGRDVAGGGGGGGVLSNLISPDLATVAIGAGDYAVIVGDGGAGGQNSTLSPENGEASSFDFIVALGGGAGGPYNSPAGSGASGGGSGRESTPGTGTSGQGFAGGSGGGGGGSGAGGGGAGEPGGDGGATGTNDPAGSGGDGLAVDITGADVYYGGGGGGTWHRNDSDTTRPSGIGGLGGGGDGANSHVVANPGGTNTGGGGGASRSDQPAYYTGGTGGSGVVVVRYLGD